MRKPAHHLVSLHRSQQAIDIVRILVNGSVLATALGVGTPASPV
jgi:hypothetical protein